eukprot:6321116-Lingulodinium_polyedra.AAC.1
MLAGHVWSTFGTFTERVGSMSEACSGRLVHVCGMFGARVCSMLMEHVWSTFMEHVCIMWKDVWSMFWSMFRACVVQ